MTVNLGDLPVPHDDGHWINERVSRVVELIREYDHRLDVRWLPPEMRGPGDAAFAIIENTPQGPVIAFMVQTEEEFDERVLARIYSGDMANGNVQENLEAKNRAVRAIREKRWQEELEEQMEIAKAVLRSPKDTYRVGKKVYRA